MSEPACARPDVDPEWFYSVEATDRRDLTRSQIKVLNQANHRKARKVCESCPIAEACLSVNLTEPYGIYAGLTPGQRAKLAAQRGLGLDPLPQVDQVAVERAVAGELGVPLSHADKLEVIRRLTRNGETSWQDIQTIARANSETMRAGRNAA